METYMCREMIIHQIFDIICDCLPFHPEPIGDDVRLCPYATIGFIPGVSHQLKRAFTKAGCNLYSKSGQKLQNILCGKNKSRPPPCKCKGIYKFQCSCNEKAVYVGETRRSIDIRAQEHKKAAESGTPVSRNIKRNVTN